MENTCSKFQEQIPKLISGTLLEQEKTELHQHINLCPKCKKYLTDLQSDDKQLGRFAEALQPRIAELQSNAIEALHSEFPAKQKILTGLGKAIFTRRIIKLTAAAVLLIAAGFAIGRFSGPGALDSEQIAALASSLKSSLEPTIQQNLREELNQQWVSVLVESYTNLKGELQEQFQGDLNEYAIETLAASSAVTNKLLTELIAAINTAQAQDRQWITAALQQMELNRQQDKALFTNNLELLAFNTEDELIRTRQDMVQLLSYTQSDIQLHQESINPETPNERNEK